MNYKMIFYLAGGLGLFIYGMKLTSEGLEKAAGDRMKKLIEVLTSNTFTAILVGTAVTALIQSSSATTVMVVGFVNAGLMNLYQAAGIIMGANIGTTLMAQLIAFNLSDYAPLMIAIGTAFLMFSKKKKTKDMAQILLGFGIIFLGMNMMSTSMSPIAKEKWFSDLILNLNNNPILGVFVGLGMTAIVQSSGATIGILQALAKTGTIGINVAIPVLFGDNIGTCATALLASIGTNKNAKRAAVIHLTFNTIGTIIFMFLLKWIVMLIEMLGGDVSRQIANTHTIFNVVNTAIQAPFIPLLVKFVNKVVPGKDEAAESMSLKYIDKRLLETPSVAVGQLLNEIVRMGNIAADNLATSIKAIINNDEKCIAQVKEKEEVINFLEKEITSFMVELSNTPLAEDQLAEVTSFFHVVNDIERIGDHAENLSEFAQYKINDRLDFSEDGEKALDKMAGIVHTSVVNAITALKESDTELAKSVIENEANIDRMEKYLREDHIGRLNRRECLPVSGTIFLDCLSNLERIGDHSNNIAEIVAGVYEKEM